MKYFVVEADDFLPQLVVVKTPGDEKAWEDTKRYLNDCGVKYKAIAVKPTDPGALSDLLAPRGG